MPQSFNPSFFQQFLQLPLRFLAKDRLSVLLFHKVPAAPDPLVPNDVTLAIFERVIDFVSSQFNIISLEDAVKGINNKHLPARAACITFDDGYAEWLGGVASTLEKRNLHATFFITDGQFAGDGLWHERIHAAVRQAIGPVLTLPGFGLPALPLHTLSDRQQAAALLEAFLKYLPAADRDALIQELECLVGLGTPAAPTMPVSDLRQLYNRGFGIGAHTRQHPILTLCDPDQAFLEIGAVRENLSALIGGRVESFAYPNGRPITDFNADHVKMVKRAGYSSAVTTQWGSAGYDTPVFQIPRATPWGPGPLSMAMQLGRNLLTKPRLITEPRDRPVKVLFVENGAGFGGAVVALQTLLSKLPPTQIECDVVSNLPVMDFDNLPAVKTHKVITDRVLDARQISRSIRAADLGPLTRPLLFAVGRADDLINRLPYLVRLGWRVLRMRPDIIHGNNEPHSNREAMLVARILRKPYVQHLRGSLALSRQTPWLLTRPNYFIPVSRWLAADLVRGGVAVERIRQIYDAVPLPIHQQPTSPSKSLRASLGLAEDTLLVAMVGMLVSWKGQDVFIDAVSLLGHTERPVAFLLVGGTPELGDKDYARGLQTQVATLALADRVMFVGQRNDLPAVLHQIDVVVSASTLPEPLGLVMLEAMASGCIFVGPAHGAATEVVKDGVNGYLFEPNSAADLAIKLNAAIECAANSSQAQLLTDKAKASVTTQFTEDRCATATLNLHRSIYHGIKS